MNTRQCLVDGERVPLVVSAVMPPGFAHGFTTRAGGVSAPPYDTLNLGLSWGDDRAHVLENRRRVLAAVGGRALHVASQVHGRSIAAVGPFADPTALAVEKADGLVTDVPGAALAVFAADCVPLLMADPITGACAAVHAGWRGVVAGVGPAALAALGRYRTRPEDVRVALGPSIGPCCFEVGSEVVAAFEEAFPAARAAGVVRERPGRKPHIDLRRALAVQLQAQGVRAEYLDPGGDCTRCDPARRFYSYRGAGGRTGQHVGIIVRVD